MSFIRVHGRVVHINDNKKKKEGAVAIGAGVATGVATGKLAGGLTHEAALAENASREHSAIAKSLKSAGPLFDKATSQARKHATKAAKESLKKSVKLEKLAFKVRGAGIAATAGLVGAGASRLIGPETDKNKKEKAAVAGAVGGAAAFGVHSVYSHAVGLRGTKKFAHAFKRAMKI